MTKSTIQIKDSQYGSSAKIAPHLGFNCFEFQTPAGIETVQVIDSAPDFEEGNSRPSANGIPILFPFPNRISNGQFNWEGNIYQLPEDKVGHDSAGNAIHGFCLDRPWRVVQSDESSVTGQFQLSKEAPDRLSLWPSDFIIEITYRLIQSTLRAEIKITNPDEVPLPWGFGTHPYFKLSIGSQSKPEETLIYVPADQEWVLNDCLPTGHKINVSPGKDLRDGTLFSEAKLDDVLTGLSISDNNMIECTLVDQNAGLQIQQRCDTGFREMVVFTPPDRNAFCMEPYTCVTDAINLQNKGIDAGLQILNPGEEYICWIEIEASCVLS